MEHELYDNMAALVAQSHGLYLRLRERQEMDASLTLLAIHAYQRYQRRLAHLPL